ncbi:hypothetical protein D3C84_1029800 [compost metagenome]
MGAAIGSRWAQASSAHRLELVCARLSGDVLGRERATVMDVAVYPGDWRVFRCRQLASAGDRPLFSGQGP